MDCFVFKYDTVCGHFVYYELRRNMLVCAYVWFIYIHLYSSELLIE